MSYEHYRDSQRAKASFLSSNGRLSRWPWSRHFLSATVLSTPTWRISAQGSMLCKSQGAHGSADTQPHHWLLAGIHDEACRATKPPLFFQTTHRPEWFLHLEEHQPVCLGFQFQDCITFMCLSTLHVLNRMACAVNCQWQIQGHLDCSFHWCTKDFITICFSLNTMGIICLSVSLSMSTGNDIERV